jgi:hypothetical protein
MTLTIRSLHSLLDPLVLPYTLPPARPNQHHPPLLLDIILLDTTHHTSTSSTTANLKMPALTPRNIAIGAGAVGAVAFLFPRSTKKVAPME